MFKFNFEEDIDANEGQYETESVQPQGLSSVDVDKKENPTQELSIDELIQDLPEVISYSSLHIPITGLSQEEKEVVTIIRRDLFDARFQLISQTNAPESDKKISDEKIDEEPDALAFIDNPSDLLPGVYEGGLKTWECSLDLVESLAGIYAEGSIRGRRVIEIGCGTAVPSLYLIKKLFHETDNRDGTADTEFVLQDYNDVVLRLVTFPNILLNWCTSPLSQDYWAKKAPPNNDEDDDEPFDPANPGNLRITTELLDAFRSSLKERNIRLRIFSGSWSMLIKVTEVFERPFDVILTSETIYQTSSLPDLIVLLKLAYRGNAGQDELETRVHNLKIDDEAGRRHQIHCLVAAKMLYFGVGGGVLDFEHLVKQAGGTVIAHSEKNIGVGRRVMSIQWNGAG